MAQYIIIPEHIFEKHKQQVDIKSVITVKV